jgi:membrane protease YdiL (CAAX protease family)
MTTDAVRAATPRAATTHAGALAGVTVIAGCVALAARPVSPAFTWITIAVGVAAVMHPFARTHPRDLGTWLGAVALGIAAFAGARGALDGSLLPPAGVGLMTAAIVTAVAEEAFFRRLVYGAWLGRGVPVALAVSSFAFAIVHVSVWGWRAFPVDLAAGVLLGWQRWVTGSWSASAVTHAAANVLMLL